jgi:hypothetical protein
LFAGVAWNQLLAPVIAFAQAGSARKSTVMIRYFKSPCDFRVGWLKSGMLQKSPTLAEQQGWATQLQRQKPASMAKKAQLQRQEASGGLVNAK